MKALLILFSFVLLTSCAQKTIQNKKLSKSSEIGRVFASEASDLTQQIIEEHCYQGTPKKCGHLGSMALDRKDFSNARKLLTRACDDDYMRGCVRLAELESEMGNEVEANKLLLKACGGRDRRACLILLIVADGRNAKGGGPSLVTCLMDYHEEGCEHIKAILKNDKWYRKSIISSIRDFFKGNKQ